MRVADEAKWIGFTRGSESPRSINKKRNGHSSTSSRIMSATALEEVFQERRANLTIVNDLSENEKVSVVYAYSDGELGIDFPSDYPEEAPHFSPNFEKLDDQVMSVILKTTWERFKNDTFRLDRLMEDFELSLLPGEWVYLR